MIDDFRVAAPAIVSASPRIRHPIGYDVTRLGSRLFYAAPNGMHRVDETLARSVFARTDRSILGVWLPRPLSHRIVSRRAAVEVLTAVEAHLAEDEHSEDAPNYRAVRRWLLAPDGEVETLPPRIRSDRPKRWGAAVRWSLKQGLGARASSGLPQGARYLNVSVYGLGVAGAFDWVQRRPDVKPVFFIHDMLPFETPEYFVAAEQKRHHIRMQNVARYAAGVVVSTDMVKRALLAHMATLGRDDLPVLVAPLPVSPIFYRAMPADPELAERPFFIQCGTIEPRKNHLMILHIWRELIARHGAAAPKLVLVGGRGWENENVLDLLERSPSLRGRVLEVSGLHTPALRRLMASARALLMPSFAEGFGLPLAEAIAAGAPALASDLPVFHEIARGRFTPLGIIDAAAWRQAIERLSGLRPDGPTPAPAFGPRHKTDSFGQDIAEFANSL